MAKHGPVIFSFLVALPAAALAAPPSFDCKATSGPAEKAICASAPLSALDVKIAEAYGRARAGLTAVGREVLKRHQKIFLDVRDQTAQQKGDLQPLLAEQLAFLRTIDTRPRTGVAGAWRNAFGTVNVAGQGGGAKLAISTAEPQTGRWVCDVEGGVETTPSGWAVKLDPDLAEGWSLRLAPHDGVLGVVALPPKGETYQAPFCGNAGTVEGDYLPIVE